MKDSGIEELLVQSGLCVAGTANKILAGKDYYQMLSYHHCPVAINAMLALEWKVFEKEMTAKSNNHDYLKLIDNLQELRSLISQNSNNIDQAKELTEQTSVLLQSMQTLG